MTTERTQSARPPAPTDRIGASGAERRDSGAFAALLDAHAPQPRRAEPRDPRTADAEAAPQDAGRKQPDARPVVPAAPVAAVAAEPAAPALEPAAAPPLVAGVPVAVVPAVAAPLPGPAPVPAVAVPAPVPVPAPVNGAPVPAAPEGAPAAPAAVPAPPVPGAPAAPAATVPEGAAAPALPAAAPAAPAAPAVPTAPVPAAAPPAAAPPAAATPAAEPAVPSAPVAAEAAPASAEAHAPPAAPAPAEAHAPAAAAPASAEAAPEPATAPGSTPRGEAGGLPSQPATPLAAQLGPNRAATLPQAPAAVATLLHVAAERGITHARMALRPAELGGIEIRLQSTPAGVAAQVIADSPEAARLLTQAGDDLRRALEARDVTLVSLEVSTSTEQQRRESGRGEFAFPGDDAHPGGRRGPDGDEAEAPAAVHSVIELPGGLLVDVLA